MTERRCKLLARERTEHAQLDETDLAAGCAQLVDARLGGACGRADEHDRDLRVLHAVFFEEAVLAAEGLFKIRRNVQNSLLCVLHRLGLLHLVLHVVRRNIVRADSERRLAADEGMLGVVLADELPDCLILLELDVLDRVRSDEAVLTYHDRQADIRCLRDAHRLEIVVIGLLIVLGVKLDPPGVPDAHGVGVVVVDVDGAGEGPVTHASVIGRRDEAATYSSSYMNARPHEEVAVTARQPAASAPMQVDMEECSDSTVTYSVST